MIIYVHLNKLIFHFKVINNNIFKVKKLFYLSHQTTTVGSHYHYIFRKSDTLFLSREIHELFFPHERVFKTSIIINILLNICIIPV